MSSTAFFPAAWISCPCLSRAGRLTLSLLFMLLPAVVRAQRVDTEADSPLEQQRRLSERGDTTRTTDVPEGIYAWTVDSRFGDIRPADYDTVPHGFQADAFTSGRTGHYNHTGNLGSPRVSRLFTEQLVNRMSDGFIFYHPYDFFISRPDQLLYTNTKSPFTNITYHECGNKTNGEDRIKALFAVNAGKRLGMGFKADYLYGRGYYEAQSTAHFDGTLYASYRGEKYQLHASVQHLQLKNRENGGIESDDYVKRPEIYPTKYGTADMPTNLSKAWNKLLGNTVFLTHRYNIGFRRYHDAKGNVVKRDALPKAFGVRTDSLAPRLSADSVAGGVQTAGETAGSAMANVEGVGDVARTTATAETAKVQPRIPRGLPGEEDKGGAAAGSVPDSLRITEEFVPVTAFIHTLRVSDNTRRFVSNQSDNASAQGYFLDFYAPGDSAYDFTHRTSVENTFAIELHEGFNRWMPMGLRVFGKHHFECYELPDANRFKHYYSENRITVGAQFLREQGKLFHYNVLGEMRTSGTDWGEFNVEGAASLDIPFRRDSLHIALFGHVRNERPSFYLRHYHGRNAWWDNDDLKKMFSTRIGGTLAFRRTRLTATFENIQNYTHFAERLSAYTRTDGTQMYSHGVGVAQSSRGTQLLAVTLSQGFKWGPFNWDTELTYQATTNKDALPLPVFSGYTNMYLTFRIAKVLRTELGADLRYFTSYYAPAYSPVIGQYATQDASAAVKVGNYPVVNAYVNFHLKRTRFYLMASHVNGSSTGKNSFLVPHYPLNRLVIRFGVSWNFIN